MIIFKDKNQYPAMPSAARTAKGDLLVVFRKAPREKKGYTHLHSLSTIMLTRSSDGGKTWGKPVELGREDLCAKQDPHLFVTKAGKILLYYFRYLFHPESELGEIEKNSQLVYLHARKKHAIATLRGVGIMSSVDDGQTFSAPRDISLPGIVSWALRGRAVQLEGGRILQAVYARKQKGRYCIDLIASDDDGENWYLNTKNIAATRKRGGSITEYVEPSLLQTREGYLHLFIRTHEGEDRAYVSLCSSEDFGKSFTPPKRTSIDGFPLDPLLLADERVLLSYGWRKNRPFGTRYKILLPDLSDIDTADEHILDTTSRSPDCGYPWAVQTEDSKVLIVHYTCGADNIRSIGGNVISLPNRVSSIP